MKEELFALEDVLKVCGLKVSKSMVADCKPLLSLMRRKLQVESATVVEKNANRVLFDETEHQLGKRSLIVSFDTAEDARMTADNKDILHHHFRSYIGTSIILNNGKHGTVVCGSAEPKAFSPEDVSLFCDVCAIIEARYQERRTTDVDNTVSNLTICSVLLSSIKAYLDVANGCVCKMEYMHQQVLSDVPALVRRALKGMDETAARLEVVCKHVGSAIERALSVAQHYTMRNKKEYYMSCFQSESAGFMKSMNEVLLRLSNLMPDHNIMWSFQLDAALAHCPHRTFTSHLLFFLEGLVFRWAAYCSSAHISLTFDSKGPLAYSGPQRHLRRQSHVMRITSNNMLRQAITANPNGMHQHLASMLDTYEESDDDAASTKSGGGSNYSGSRSRPAPAKGSRSAGQGQGQGQREIQHGFLRIFFQPLDISYFDKDHPRPERQPRKKQLSAMLVSSTPLSSPQVVRSRKTVGAGTPRNKSGRPRSGSKVQPEEQALQCEQRFLSSPPPSSPPSSRKTPAAASPVEASSKTPAATPTPGTSPTAAASGAFAFPSASVSGDSPSPAGTPTAETASRAPRREEIQRAVSSLYEDEILMKNQHLSPYKTTEELMHVMDDFLRAIDPEAHASVAPLAYAGCLSEPTSVAFMISLPCYFMAQRQVVPAVRPVVARRPSLSMSADGAELAESVRSATPTTSAREGDEGSLRSGRRSLSFDVDPVATSYRLPLKSASAGHGVTRKLDELELRASRDSSKSAASAKSPRSVASASTDETELMEPSPVQAAGLLGSMNRFLLSMVSSVGKAVAPRRKVSASTTSAVSPEPSFGTASMHFT